MIRELCPGGVRFEPIGSVGTLVRGKRFVKADMVNDGIPCLHYGEIYTRYGLSAHESFSFLPEEQARSLRFANPGDVVMVSAGESVEDIGKSVAWLGTEPIVIHDACYAFSSPLDPRFVSHYFASRLFRDQIRTHISSSKISSVSVQTVSRTLIPVPPQSLQNEIVRILDSFDALVTDISIGLPAEIAARRKQYEYYRDKLLSFEGLAA
jgi:type I restriction enzyme S subunit